MKTINCNQRRHQFDDRLDGRLDERQGAEFDRHVAVCPECGHEWQEYAAAWQVLTRPAPITPSFGFVERTLRRLDESPPSRIPSWFEQPVWRWALAGALALLLAGSGWLLEQRQETRRAAELYAAVKHVDQVDDFDVIASLDLLNKKGLN